MRSVSSRTEKAKKIIEHLKILFPKAQTALEYSNPLELLVAVILSARNTDKKVNEVTDKLFKKYKTLDDFKNADIKVLESSLSQLGLFRQKAKFVKESARIISEEYNGVIPRDMQSLIKLPGVGRKTANVVLGNIYGIVEGIAVDTHVTRLSRLFGLTENSDPNKIEKDLMEILPKNEWFDFTNRIISYGREYCPAHCKHLDCPLKNFIQK